MNHLFSNALLTSLRTSSLLVGDLEQARSLDRKLLGSPYLDTALKLDQKLGHLYEDALRSLLLQSSQLDLLDHHVQVFDADRITIGEMDYILRDRNTGELIHLELAVKFYLAVREKGDWHFPGPDPRDNWQRKLARLRDHQLQLSQRHESLALFAQRWQTSCVTVRQLIYGCLFYPMGESECPIPEGVQPDCRKGRWLYESEWDTHFAEMTEVSVIPKTLWPVEITDELRTSLLTKSVADLRAARTQHCVMFILPDSTIPYFLVPNNWLLPER